MNVRNKSGTLSEWVRDSGAPDRERLFAQERLIVAVAEHIWDRMEKRRVSKADIAASLDKSKAFVSQVLDGSRNMTLRTLSDIAFALDSDVTIDLQPKRAESGWCTADAGVVVQSHRAFPIELPVSEEAANDWVTERQHQFLLVAAEAA